MKAVQKAAIGGTAVLVLAVGGELLYLHHERSAPGVQVAPAQETAIDPDDLVFLKKERPSSMADLKELYGKTIWVSAGGQMDYYPYAGRHADYAKSAGTLLGAEPLVVKDAFEQVAPKAATYRIPGATGRCCWRSRCRIRRTRRRSMRCRWGMCRAGTLLSIRMRFFSMTIRMSCTSTGGRRYGRRWTRTR
jgi:hypothetical protein